MIMRKLNPRVYNSLLMLLDAVRLYRVNRRLDTLPLYLYYKLLVSVVEQGIKSISIAFLEYCYIDILFIVILMWLRDDREAII